VAGKNGGNWEKWSKDQRMETKKGEGTEKTYLQGEKCLFRNFFQKHVFYKNCKKKKNFAWFSILNLVICARTRESIIYNLLQITKMNYIF
jgi:hypothetical protein